MPPSKSAVKTQGCDLEDSSGMGTYISVQRSTFALRMPLSHYVTICIYAAVSLSGPRCQF